MISSAVLQIHSAMDFILVLEIVTANVNMSVQQPVQEMANGALPLRAMNTIAMAMVRITDVSQMVLATQRLIHANPIVGLQIHVILKHLVQH